MKLRLTSPLNQKSPWLPWVENIADLFMVTMQYTSDTKEVYETLDELDAHRPGYSPWIINEL